MSESSWEWLVSKVGFEFATVLLPIAGAIGWTVLRLIWAGVRRAQDFLASRRRALAAVARADSPDGPREGPGVWTLKPIGTPDNYRNNIRAARVLAIANLKGGVGKTTIAANIAAHLADHSGWRKRILLVDLDYQGSLSSMTFPDDKSWLPPPGTDSVASRCLSGDLEPNLFLAACKDVVRQPRLKVITAHYDLAQADTRLLVEWLLNVRSKDRRAWSRWFADLFAGRIYEPNEMRYNLAKLLHSEAVREAFDLVIIDCPPRLTAGTIQALCASSNVLIPTILDRPSGESVISFCEQLEKLKSEQLCPHLRYVGVVATRYVPTHNASQLTIQMVSDRLAAQNLKCGFLPHSTFIPQTTALVREASEGIAYFNLRGDNQAIKAKSALISLAHHVAHQVGIPPVQSFLEGQDFLPQLNLPVAAE